MSSELVARAVLHRIADAQPEITLEDGAAVVTESVAIRAMEDFAERAFSDVETLRARLEALEADKARLKRERDDALKALDFYGNRENYIEPTVEQARKTRGGDPVISRTGVGKAAPGHALSAIQLDNFGDVARAARRAREGGNADG